MANISLEGSIRTCKVDTAWANRIESDRFFNPNNMVCPPWTQHDNAGRAVSWNSFNTKTAGCNSADDRLSVENTLRPQYIEYVNLNADGIRGGECLPNQTVNADALCQQNTLSQAHNVTGQYGLGWRHNIQASCTSCQVSPDMKGMQSQEMRKNQFKEEAYKSYMNKRRGFRY
jgi:hypothetical protein